MFELGVAIGVRRALARFLERVQAIAEPVQELPDRRRAHGPAVRGQRPGQLRGALARPSQGRHRVAARQRLDQQVQGLGHPRLRLLGSGRPAPGWRMRSVAGTPCANSRRPFRIVCRASPVADETIASPPKPIAIDSAAAYNRCVRSLSSGPITTYLATSVASRSVSRRTVQRLDHVSLLRGKPIHA